MQWPMTNNQLFISGEKINSVTFILKYIGCHSNLNSIKKYKINNNGQ